MNVLQQPRLWVGLLALVAVSVAKWLLLVPRSAVYALGEDGQPRDVRSVYSSGRSDQILSAWVPNDPSASGVHTRLGCGNTFTTDANEHQHPDDGPTACSQIQTPRQITGWSLTGLNVLGVVGAAKPPGCVNRRTPSSPDGAATHTQNRLRWDVDLTARVGGLDAMVGTRLAPFALVSAVLTLAFLSLLGGCTVSVGDNSEDSLAEGATGSIMRDGQATIDLRRRPTREEWGFTPGRNHKAYQAGFAPAAGVDTIATTVTLPTGTLQIPAFVVAATSGSVGTHTSPHPLPPKEILVQRRFATGDQALRSLLHDGPVLGFSAQDTDMLLARIGPTSGTGTPQQGVLDGFVRDWLSAYVEVIGYEEGEVGVNYHFMIDYFDPAAVVRDGVFALDLTHRPSRDELGFTQYADIAEITRPWNASLAILLTLPSGVIQRPIEAVTSAENQTFVDLGSGSVPDMHRILAEDAAILGVDPAAVEAVYSGRSDGVPLPGRSTDVYHVEVRASADLDQPGQFSAGLTYVFTYR